MKKVIKFLPKVTFILVLLTFAILSNGQYVMSFAIWISTAMLLFAVRRLKKWKGILFAFLIIGISHYIGFDIIPFLPIYMLVILTAIYAVFAIIPYLIDSFFSKNRASFLSTLIFPTASVLIEYAYHQLNAYGSWGHLAYTQQSQDMLLQSISVFGMGYITFLITWFAAVANWVYEQRNQLRNIKMGVGVYSLVLVFTLLYGGYRIQLKKANSETVRVASISTQDGYGLSFYLSNLNDEVNGKAHKSEAKEQISRLNQHLFDRSTSEAEAGAKIVFWAEGNGTVLKEDEQDFYSQASQVANNQNIFLGIAVAVLDHTQKRYLENKFVVFDPNGDKAIDYWKGISVPGSEAPISNNRVTGIQKISTDYGTLAAAICFDMDFPEYLRGAKGADILLAPSNDYKEIDPIHTDMAKVRAIEQGFNLIRHTSNGLSRGTDYTGKVLSEMDHFNDNDRTMITQLPTKGVKTIYSIIGDSFVAFCLILLAVTMVALKKLKRVPLNNPKLSVELG